MEYDTGGVKRIYEVIVNHEEQYSIWPAEQENPFAWRDGGKKASMDECLGDVKQVRVDMRPLSLRQRMEQASRGQ